MVEPRRGSNSSERRSENRQGSCLWIPRLVDDADMRGDDFPALGKSQPCLHLPSPLAGSGVAIKQCRCYGGVAAIGCDHRLRGRAHQPDRRARGAKRHDRVIAIEIIAHALTKGGGIGAEQFAEDGDVVRHQRLLVTRKLLGHLSEHVGEIEVHFYNPLGRGAETTPALSSAKATRNAISSRQGAAMTCTPIGIGFSGTGTATTG